MKKKIILASASPRRKEILETMGLDFEVMISHADESADESLPFDRRVMEISRKKALAVKEGLNEDCVIISADTIVVCENEILGKPKDEREAFHMLGLLSGRTHTVYTGITVAGGAKSKSYSDCAEVSMKALSSAEISAYIATGEPFDKAGGYAVQGKSSVFIEGIKGDYFTVVGLSASRLYEALKEFDIDITDFWK